MPDMLPIVTVILPCRNEEEFIAGCLDSLVSSDYPKDRLEVLVVDGMSEDGTREILAGYTARHEFIKMIENVKRTTPCAFNRGIEKSHGDIIMIMGMHATYASDYISKCVKYLIEYGADNVGGGMVTVPRDGSLMGKAIAQALSHKFGVGNSMFRTGTKKPAYVDTVFGGCYKRDVFDKIGMFNEKLTRNQDIELNYRLKKSGGRILLVPEISCKYYARSEIKPFLANTWGNAVYTMISLRESEITPVSLRHLIPLAFVSSLIVSAALSIFFPVFLWALSAILFSYASAALYFSFRISKDRKDPKLLLAMPPVFGLLHIGHGLGSLYGALCLLASKRFWSGHILAARNAPARLK
jgi:cellulose synthase/poly-beta-1,6-N-acetylglucosamine synthase-like glycosyltransferase